jgi:hypothetical protein
MVLRQLCRARGLTRGLQPHGCPAHSHPQSMIHPVIPQTSTECLPHLCLSRPWRATSMTIQTHLLSIQLSLDRFAPGMCPTKVSSCLPPFTLTHTPPFRFFLVLISTKAYVLLSLSLKSTGMMGLTKVHFCLLLMLRCCSAHLVPSLSHPYLPGGLVTLPL